MNISSGEGVIVLMVLIMSSTLLAYMVLSRRAEMEKYTNSIAAAKMPVSDFTYDYMQKNVSISKQNQLYAKMNIVNDKGTTVKNQPKVVQGTLIDVPRMI